MDILQQLNQIAQERDIPLQDLQHELEESLAVAYKKFIGIQNDVSVTVTIKLSPLSATVGKEVVAIVTDARYQISLDDARKTFRLWDVLRSFAGIDGFDVALAGFEFNGTNRGLFGA